MTYLSVLIWGVCMGILIGERSAEKRLRHAAKIGESVASAVIEVRDARKFVGEGCVIRKVATYSIGGEAFTVTVEPELRP